MIESTEVDTTTTRLTVDEIAPQETMETEDDRTETDDDGCGRYWMLGAGTTEENKEQKEINEGTNDKYKFLSF